ncbi:hypothetical protein M6B38_195920 [Iris pallida]|uniref:Uncharacterized protein n=1 Tax=Iris pallida TaxID=29817 RepID=A0AAX6ECI4_IRIPA|nr:hypothetical protein M6B38_195920 [Iris pallida]
MVVTFDGVNSASGLKKLNDYHLTRSYISGLVLISNRYI